MAFEEVGEDVLLDEAQLKSISRNIRALFVETPSRDDVTK